MNEIRDGMVKVQKERAYREVKEEIQKEFEKRLNEVKPWNEVSIFHPYCLNTNLLQSFSKEVIRSACMELGLRVYCVNDSMIWISIPKTRKGKKKTKAQEMLQDFNATLLIKTKEAKASAKKECDKLIQKLLNKQYSAVGHRRRCTMFEVAYFEPFRPDYSTTDVFVNEVSRRIMPYGISKVSFDWDDRFGKVATWILFVDDSKFAFI